MDDALKNVKEVDTNALFNIGYGLYVITTNDGSRDNGLIVNTVQQVTNTPEKIAVTINKENYSHDIIKKNRIMNVNCIDESAPFSVFERFGFSSGRNTDKFKDLSFSRTDNGLAVLDKHINAVMCLEVCDYVDLDTHGMFICTLTAAKTLSDKTTMTYTYYHKNVKPTPKKKKGWVCKICGYVYEGENLPEDFICPLCKHPASDFEPLI